jgi:hypothetical protein
VAGSWGEGGREAGTFPDGATLQAGPCAWVLLDADPVRRLGAALAWAQHHAVEELHLIVDDADVASVLARRASAFTSAPTVWRTRDRDLAIASAAPPAEVVPPPAAAEPFTAQLADAGLDVVVEGGEVMGEVLGLEVARVVAGDGGARLEAGVGRFDREAFGMLHGDLGDVESLARVAEVVRAHRRADVDPHPLNRLSPERWLRAMVLAEPAAVGAAELAPVEPALTRPNLTVRVPASAAGVDADGAPVVVACSTGVDLDLVPSGADDRLAHSPEARLVLALPQRDVLPVTRAVAGSLRAPAEIVELSDDWRLGLSAC